MAAKL
ncbi:hypothetical protein VTL71DRAFT_8207 [Oculimacula yallundae]